MMKLRLLCFVAVIGLLAGPAMANIFVSTQPEDCVVSLSEGDTHVGGLGADPGHLCGRRVRLRC